VTPTEISLLLIYVIAGGVVSVTVPSYCDDYLLKWLWLWTDSAGEILNWDIWISKTKILQTVWGLWLTVWTLYARFLDHKFSFQISLYWHDPPFHSSTAWNSFLCVILQPYTLGPFHDFHKKLCTGWITGLNTTPDLCFIFLGGTNHQFICQLFSS